MGVKKSLDPLDYLNTTIYDVLDSCYPELLKGDFSFENLVKTLLKLGKINPIYQNEYNNIFDSLITNLKNFSTRRIPNNRFEITSKRFVALKVCSPLYKECHCYEDYIHLAEEHADDPEYEMLQDVILSEGAQTLTKERINKYRSALLAMVYIPKYREIIKVMGEESPDRGVHTELNEKLFQIQQFVSNSDKLFGYDESLQSVNIQRDAISDKLIDGVECDLKRKRAIRDKLIDSLVESQSKSVNSQAKLDISKQFFIPQNPLTKDVLENIQWFVKEYKTPKVILNKKTNYSEDGKENEQVIAVSYGQFNFTTKFPNFSGAPIEMVVVSRLGQDENKKYFALVPLDLSYSSNSRANIATTGRNFELCYNSIPNDLQQFYADVLFSNEYLKSAIDDNYRYIGRAREINNQGLEPKIELDTIDKKGAFLPEILAAQYASTHESIGGDIKFSGTKYNYGWHAFSYKQDGIVQEIVKENELIRDEKE